MSNRWVSYSSIRSDLNELSDFYHPTQTPHIDIRLVGHEPPPPLPEKYDEIESEDEEDEVLCRELDRKGPNLNRITDMLQLIEDEESSIDTLKGFVSKPPEPTPRHVYIDIQKPTKTSKRQQKNIIPVNIKRKSPEEKPQEPTSLSHIIPSFGFRKAITSIQQQVANENHEKTSTTRADCQPSNGLNADVPEFIPRKSRNRRKNHLTPDATEFVPGHLCDSQVKQLSLPSSVVSCSINDLDKNSKQKLDDIILSKGLKLRNIVPDKTIVKRKIVKDKPEDLVDVFNICNSELLYANKKTIDLPSTPQTKLVTNSHSTQSRSNTAIESILLMSRTSKETENQTPSPPAVKLLTPNDFKISSVNNTKAPSESFDLLEEIRKLGLESRKCQTPINDKNIEDVEKEKNGTINTIETSEELKRSVDESYIPTVATLERSGVPAFTGHDKVNEWLNGPRREIVRPKDYTKEMLKPFGFRKIDSAKSESRSSSTTLPKEVEKMSSSSSRTTPVREYQPRASYYELYAKLTKSAEEKEKARVQSMDWWEKAEHLMKKKDEEKRNGKRISKAK